MGGSVFMLLSLLLLFDATEAHSFSFEAIAGGVKNLTEKEILLKYKLSLFYGLVSNKASNCWMRSYANNLIISELVKQCS